MKRYFYKKGMNRFIYEYTNWKWNEIIEDNLLCDGYEERKTLNNAMLDNISKLWTMLTYGYITVNEYMKILSDIENYTIDRLY